MKKDSGFTLVELLAVIVVLSIILAIAVPGIIGIMKNSTKASFKSDAKMVLTAIDYRKLENEKFNPLEVTKENMSSIIGLGSSNYEQVNISVDNGEISLVLVGKEKWAGFTAYGNIKNMRVVDTNDYDVIPPSITILGDNPKEIGKNSIYIDEGATAYDLKDGEIQISTTIIRDANGAVVGSIDTSTFTTFTITYTATDSQGNETSSVRRVNIVDREKPTITLLGENPTTVYVGAVYIDEGAAALDETDGNITSKIVTTGSVNPNVVGSYYISYDVSDESGNNADTVTRTINVVDNVAPIVSFGTNGNSTYAKMRSTTVTVNDNVDVNSNSLKYLWNTSEIEPEESSFVTNFVSGDPIATPTGVTGSYYLWVIAKDIYNNTTIIKSNAFNLDNIAPVLTLNGDSAVTIDKGSIYSDLGASADDNIDGDITSNIVLTGTVNPNIVGSYTITYNVMDSSGNSATAITRTINVIDVLAPIITILGNNPVNINAGGSYIDAGATALDDVDGNVTSSIITTGLVNPNVVGTYTITYTVSDNAGNQAIATRIVNVLDTIIPTVTFGTNGNSTWAKMRSTTVTVSDANSGVNASSLKYLWNTSTTTPNESSFTTSFTNGGTLSTPTGVTGGYYLWVLAKDNANNTTIIRTNVFNLDNTVPIITINGNASVVVNVGSSYTDAGATANDSHSGVSGSVATSGTVNTATPGTYTLTYNVSDNAGNAALAKTRTITVMATVYNFAYTGNYQSFTVPVSGIYQIEVWGAQGGGVTGINGGLGGYSVGRVSLTGGSLVYVYVGGQNGWNGGANGGSGTNGNSGAVGGGATDVRLTIGDLYTRLIVAGGGGGAGGNGQGGGSSIVSGTGGVPGVGGGITSTAGAVGTSTADVSGNGGGAASENSAGSGGSPNSGSSSSEDRTYYPAGGGGAGGGWYGGGGGAGASIKGSCGNRSGAYGNGGTFGAGGIGGAGASYGCGYYSGSGGGGAGGSGYVLTSTSAKPSGYNPSSQYYMTNTQTIAGNASMPATGGGTETGHAGNGYARITFISN